MDFTERQYAEMEKSTEVCASFQYDHADPMQKEFYNCPVTKLGDWVSLNAPEALKDRLQMSDMPANVPHQYRQPGIPQRDLAVAPGAEGQGGEPQVADPMVPFGTYFPLIQRDSETPIQANAISNASNPLAWEDYATSISPNTTPNTALNIIPSITPNITPDITSRATPNSTPQGGSSQPPGNSKRRRGKDDGGDPPDRQNQKRRPSQVGKPRTQFICPYYAQDPKTYFRCLDYDLHRVGDVRQHILRKHVQKSHCPNCGMAFEDDLQGAARTRHINDRQCEIVSFHHPGATPDQVKKMQDATKGSVSRPDEDKWCEIWNSFFPDNQRPISPYLAYGFGVHAHLILEYPYTNRFQQNLGRLLLLTPVGFHETAAAYLKEMIEDMALYSMQRYVASSNQGDDGDDLIREDDIPLAPLPLIASNLDLSWPPTQPAISPTASQSSSTGMFNLSEDLGTSAQFGENMSGDLDSFGNAIWRPSGSSNIMWGGSQ